jgi:hypothetical protein
MSRFMKNKHYLYVWMTVIIFVCGANRSLSQIEDTLAKWDFVMFISDEKDVRKITVIKDKNNILTNLEENRELLNFVQNMNIEIDRAKILAWTFLDGKKHSKLVDIDKKKHQLIIDMLDVIGEPVKLPE